MRTYEHALRRRWITQVAGWVGSRAPLDPDRLLGLARRAQGLEVLTHASVHTGLRELCDSLERDGDLTALGRFMAREYIVRLLGANLRCASEPEPTGSLGAPLVVVGLHRSGTTRLHHLLGLDPRARFLPAWRTMRAHPPATSPALIRQGKLDILSWRVLAPEADARHRHSAVDPEEEGVLLANTFHTAQLYETFPAPAYLRWAHTQPLTRSYAFLRERLLAFQEHLPGERWVLKYPGHLLSLDLLIETMPGAHIIHTHRDPMHAVCSYAGLIADTHAVMTDDPLRPELVESTVWRCEQSIIRSIEARRDHPALASVHDVSFEDLVQRPIEAVRTIYDRFGLEWDTEHEERMTKFLSRPHLRPARDDRPARYGLDAPTLRRRLAPYLDRYAPFLAGA